MSTLVHLDTDPGDGSRVRTALARRRDDLAGHGIEVGRERTGRAAQQPRRVLSTDAADGTPSDLPELLAQDGSRVLVSLRPLPARLFSTWAHEVENGLACRYEHWLTGVLDPSSAAAYAWLLRPEQLIADLVEATGQERLEVLVTGAARGTLRAIERQLDVPPRTLGAPRRGLSAPEAELIRLVNERFSEERWPEPVRVRYVEVAVRAITRSGRRQVGVAPVPEPVRQEVARLGTGTASALDSLAGCVVGDPRRLARRPRADPAPSRLSTAAAARAVAAAVRESDAAAREQSPLLEDASPRDLLAEVYHRVRARRTRP